LSYAEVFACVENMSHFLDVTRFQPESSGDAIENVWLCQEQLIK